MHVYGNYMLKKQRVGLLVYLLDIHTRTRHSGHQRTGDGQPMIDVLYWYVVSHVCVHTT